MKSDTVVSNEGEQPVVLAEPARKKRHYTNYLIAITAFMSIGSTCYGFSCSVIGTTLGQPSFYATMQLTSYADPEAILGATTALWYIGAVFGSLCIGIVADRWGRRVCIGMGALLIVVSSALLTASSHIAMYAVFRFFNGWGAFQICASVAIWIGEIAPPEMRGTLTEFHGIMVAFGFTCTAFIGVGFYYVTGNNAWRGPTGLQMVAPSILLLGLWKIPESPRWLVMRGRDAEALAILKRVHGTSDGSEFAEIEYQQIRGQVEFDRNHPSTYREIFSKPSNRKRLMFTCFFQWCLAGTGVLVINNYGAVIYSSLGFSPVDILLILAGWVLLCTLSACVAVFVVDRVSRVHLIAGGFFSCCVSLVVLTALQSVYIGDANAPKAGLIAIAAFTYVFVPGYIIGLEGAQFFYNVELWPLHLRSKGMSIAMLVCAVANIVFISLGPTAFANIGWRYFIVFIVHAGVAGTVVLLFYPNTRNKPLEEIAAMFGDAAEVVSWDAAAHAAHTDGVLDEKAKTETHHETVR